MERLRGHAAAIRCIGLQGEVALDGAELVVRRMAEMGADARHFVIDLRRVHRLEPSAARLLHEARSQLAREGRTVVFGRRCTRTRTDPAG